MKSEKIFSAPVQTSPTLAKRQHLQNVLVSCIIFFKLIFFQKSAVLVTKV